MPPAGRQEAMQCIFRVPGSRVNVFQICQGGGSVGEVQSSLQQTDRSDSLLHPLPPATTSGLAISPFPYSIGG